MPAGRPTEFTEELGDRILDLMNQGLSLAAAAAECDVHRQRVYEWEAKHKEFADTIKLARVKRLLFLERRLLAAADGPTVTSSIFALKNASPEDWRDVKAQEISGPSGGPVQHQLNTASLSESALREIAAATPDV